MAMLNNQRVYEIRVHKGIWKRQLMKNPMTLDEMGKNKETLRGSGMVLAMFSRQDLELNRDGTKKKWTKRLKHGIWTPTSQMNLGDSTYGGTPIAG